MSKSTTQRTMGRTRRWLAPCVLLCFGQIAPATSFGHIVNNQAHFSVTSRRPSGRRGKHLPGRHVLLATNGGHLAAAAASPVKERSADLKHHRIRVFGACFAMLLAAAFTFPRPSYASLLSHIPSRADFKATVVSTLDTLSSQGARGEAIYAMIFVVWTMTVGVTTPIETAGGAAFPLGRAISLSAIGKIGGAILQYMLAKYLFSSVARERLKDNEWMDKIKCSFQNNPLGVALIWRFSPLPEFVKNVGPALVETLRTPYQILAILLHGLPFTVLWSCVGNDAAIVARGGKASVWLPKIFAAIQLIGLFVTPTLFGWWLKGLEKTEECVI